MANSKGSTNVRNLMYSGKHALLPPKSPFPSVSPSYADYVLSPAIGSKVVQKPREGNAHHQRTSSESFLAEEQPSWLDDLLNEPETPVRRGGHRRSSSDSFAYVDAIDVSNFDYAPQDDYKYRNLVPTPSWGSQDFDHHKDLRHASFYAEMNLAKQKNRAWESPLNPVNNPSGLPSGKDNISHQGSGSFCMPQEADGHPSTASERRDIVETSPHDPRTSEKKDSLSTKSSSSETDTKRAKQQFAQRSRVRKLQYIAELERNVQALQASISSSKAEGSEVSAELEFLNQQNLILSMENKALKQRLENLAQEQLIKYMEHEVLEREIGRLRSLYKQQQQQPQPQQQQQPSSSHRRTNSRDLESQFSNLSLKHKDSNSGRDSVTGQLRI
ncbi:Basic-leucine zipper transcription factor [Trema orientale]|uniref:Basic-leucine zipper transcription factor n=1 Tax=Trema orientale TaxID=63057 RepID=A0A2P5CAW1_TREOI|nr:Basic-leucine zipper transcription factor [Trema orientale]